MRGDVRPLQGGAKLLGEEGVEVLLRVPRLHDAEPVLALTRRVEPQASGAPVARGDLGAHPVVLGAGRIFLRLEGGQRDEVGPGGASSGTAGFWAADAADAPP